MSLFAEDAKHQTRTQFILLRGFGKRGVILGILPEVLLLPNDEPPQNVAHLFFGDAVMLHFLCVLVAWPHKAASVSPLAATPDHEQT